MNRWLSTFSLMALLPHLIACDNDVASDKIVDIQSASVIVGRDNRQPITEDYTFFDRPVGVLLGESNEGRIIQCTGVAIARNYVLTAAHCLYNLDMTPLRNISFLPGVREDFNFPFGRFFVEKMYHPEGYDINDSSYEAYSKDIAIVKVGQNYEQRDLNNVVGAAGIIGGGREETYEVATIGYPSDKPYGAVHMEDGCYMDRVKDTLFETNCDVISGQSGSPVYTENGSGSLAVRGVISGEAEDRNVVTSLTSSRINIIQAIRAGQYNFTSETGEEKWIEVNNYAQQKVRVIVYNWCRDPIYVAHSSHDDDDIRRGVGHGFIKIESRNAFELLRTPYASYRLSIHSTSGVVLIGNNDRHMKDVGGWSFPFDHFRVERYGDHVHRVVSCGQ